MYGSSSTDHAGRRSTADAAMCLDVLSCADEETAEAEDADEEADTLKEEAWARADEVCEHRATATPKQSSSRQALGKLSRMRASLGMRRAASISAANQTTPGRHNGASPRTC